MSKKEFFIPLCLLVLLVLVPRAFANSCPTGQVAHDRTGDCVAVQGTALTGKVKVSRHHHGGTCERISRQKVISVVAKALTRGKSWFSNYQQACKHNIELVEADNEKILKISTRLGDGIHGPGWSDIRAGNRRRFEFYVQQEVITGTKFSLEYSVRVMSGPIFSASGAPWFFITQLHGGGNTGPVMTVSLDKEKGMKAFGNVIQYARDWGTLPHYKMLYNNGTVTKELVPGLPGRWVKIKIEFKPTRKTDGFRRLWVNDELVVDENNIQTVTDSVRSRKFTLRMGIYQGTFNTSQILRDTTQSVEFKNISFKRI